jgi:hypothetical protein
MRRHILTGSMGTLWGNLITGIVFIYFGNAIGMSQFEWGVLGAIGSWVIVAQPIGALLGERLGSRKRVWFWFAITDRFLRFLGIIAAFLLMRSGGASARVLFITAICIASLVGNIATPPWYGWLATIIPKEVQGSFWGRRDAWISLAVIVIVVPCGLVMDLIPPDGKIETALIILSAAGLIGFADIIIHGSIPEPPTAGNPSGGSLVNVLKPLKDKRFGPWLVFTAGWNLAQSLGGALCTLYFMENLGFKSNLFGGTIAVTATALAAGVLTARRGGRAVDRWGIRRVLFISYFFWSFLPLFWLFATPSTGVFWVGLANVILGIFSLSANNAGIKLVTRFSRREESAMYMAVSNAVANIAAGLGSLAAGSFLKAVGAWSFTVGRLVVSGFPMLFIMSAVLRLVAVFVFVPRIREKGAVPADQRRFLLPMFFPLPRIGGREKEE